MEHTPVLLQESLAGLNISHGRIFVDATFGRGGHSDAIFKRMDKDDRLIVIDQDPEAIMEAERRYGADKRVSIYHRSFSDLTDIAEREGILGKVDGILFDFGVSSPQLDQPERGFSFMNDGPLDMRMNNTKGMTAAEWLAGVEESTLMMAIKAYGEEKFAARIARAIIAKRSQTPFLRTKQLADLVASVVPTMSFLRKGRQKHPATRTFQAIRMVINNELEVISTALDQCLTVLNVGGRLVVISFHSLEDRLVKQFMRKYIRGVALPKGLPVMNGHVGQRLRALGRATKASDAEVEKNSRARSAVLRIAEKIA
ncbi:MAG: 16S rRNA (cytosine(1402)-N(4))-methyltransferase RsmH [Gammaproteobacteria bacterium]|nr:16S rRNA (cytosine(1402)-N(4))-methyltransferase RsmH [Gammaproteobacteria bacterium]MCD8542163.1 16S rRNA (cytosine(1402)-N(4))-methyltransferase RsmH [Gammaproteobacteria bacterium]